MKPTRRKGALIVVLAPVLFVLSGLFLANTVVNPVESLAYQVGEVLCFIIAPMLLILGIIVYATAPHEKRKKHIAVQQAVVSPPRVESTVAYSASILLARRIIGLSFTLILLVAPFIAEGAGGINLFLAMFVAFPFPIFTIPYFVAALYLSSSKRPRKIDVLAILICVTILLSLLTPGMSVVVIFFLPFILLSTPFGLILLVFVIVVLIARNILKKVTKSSPELGILMNGCEVSCSIPL